LLETHVSRCHKASAAALKGPARSDAQRREWRAAGKGESERRNTKHGNDCGRENSIARLTRGAGLQLLKTHERSL
jgi:hypothetical protein